MGLPPYVSRYMEEPLVAVFRSVTRAYTLSILAGTRVPQTAYRIAKLAGLSPPNVYGELRRLEKVGVVTKDPRGWILANDKLRSFCEGSGPLYRRRFSPELRTSLARGVTRPLGAGSGNRIGPKEAAREPRLLREFSRSMTKNALLRAAGLRPSRHRGR